MRNKHITIDVSKFTGTVVGKQTIQKLAKELEAYRKKGYTQIEVDLRHLSLQKDSLEELAYLKTRYECEYLGLGDKEGKLEAYIGTGLFLKRELGVENYVKLFRRVVEMADFPLMIKDNRLMDDDLIELNVIQPIAFTDVHFHYNMIKPHLLEPRELEQAIWVDKKDIFTQESVYLSDIGEELSGYRFATTLKERTMLDIFSRVIDGSLRGFCDGR